MYWPSSQNGYCLAVGWEGVVRGDAGVVCGGGVPRNWRGSSHLCPRRCASHDWVWPQIPAREGSSHQDCGAMDAGRVGADILAKPLPQDRSKWYLELLGCWVAQAHSNLNLAPSDGDSVEWDTQPSICCIAEHRPSFVASQSIALQACAPCHAANPHRRAQVRAELYHCGAGQPGGRWSTRLLFTCFSMACAHGWNSPEDCTLPNLFGSMSFIRPLRIAPNNPSPHPSPAPSFMSHHSS